MAKAIGPLDHILPIELEFSIIALQINIAVIIVLLLPSCAVWAHFSELT